MLEAPGEAVCLQLLAQRGIDVGLGVLQTSNGRGWGQCRALLLDIISGLENRLLLVVQHT
jgi:hypothetical protein